MIKLILLSLGMAAVTASATAAATQKASKIKQKITPHKEKAQYLVSKIVDEPAAKEYYMDYMFV